MVYLTNTNSTQGSLFGNAPLVQKMSYAELEEKVQTLEAKLEKCLSKKKQYKYAPEPVGMLSAKKSFIEAQGEREKYMKRKKSPSRSRSRSPRRSRSRSPRRSRSRSPRRSRSRSPSPKKYQK